MSFDLTGARVWLTGASAGIGAATAVRLAHAGARLALCARRRDRLDSVRGSLRDPSSHLVLQCDVTSPESVKSAAAELEVAWGGLDALVANAGVGAWTPVAETDEATLDHVVQTNFNGVVRCIRAAVPLLRQSRRGDRRIVLVTSGVGFRGYPGLGVYSATKAALHGLADVLRVELDVDAIATSIVAPGLTATEFKAASLGAPRDRASDGIPPEAVADVIARALEIGGPVYALNAKARLAGILNLLWPRFVDRKMRALTRSDASSPT
ncbi:MAG: SDR family NAD(P)-dependent oxidoreductase [Planctomycetes bacterium]|nr:SDR family NAD(P)-dependent oxidoreductase [Planctomycetota bacterium]